MITKILLNSILLNNAHVTEHTNFHFYMTYPTRIIWKNRQVMANIQHQLFLNQTMCISKFMCQEEIKFSFAVAMRVSFHKKDVSL